MFVVAAVVVVSLEVSRCAVSEKRMGAALQGNERRSAVLLASVWRTHRHQMREYMRSSRRTVARSETSTYFFFFLSRRRLRTCTSETTIT